MAEHKSAAPDRQIDLAGKQYTLRFSLRALVALEDHYKRPLSAIFQQFGSNGGPMIRDIAAMLWAGFREHHRDLTVEGVLDILNDCDFSNVTDQVLDAWQASQGPGDEAGGTHPPEAASEAGTLTAS